jgi:hypothetical protein
VDNFDWNRWTTSNGTGGQLQTEWPDNFERNTQIIPDATFYDLTGDMGAPLGVRVEFLSGGTEVPVPEPSDIDHDGVPDSDDECPSSNLAATVMIGTCDSGVMNPIFPNGCTISDEIKSFANKSKKQSHFFTYVTVYVNGLQIMDVITDGQKRAIQSCASKAKIP